jgi:hypothetical protein
MPTFTTTFVAPDGTLLPAFNPLFYNVNNFMQIVSNLAVSSGSASTDIVGINLPFNADQYVEAVLGAVAGGVFTGVACRCGAAGSGNAYFYFGHDTISYFAKLIASAFTIFGTGSAFNAADLVRLEANGSLITPLLNGLADIAPVTDTDLPGGVLGASAYSNGGTTSGLQSLTAGDLFPPAASGTLMMPAFVGAV